MVKNQKKFMLFELKYLQTEYPIGYNSKRAVLNE